MLNGTPYQEKSDYITYARWSHWSFLGPASASLYGRNCNPLTEDLKRYQDLLVYHFIINYIKPGAKILEIGGGSSRVLLKLRKKYECWNIDKLEGLGNGPTSIFTDGITLVKDYIGDFSTELPENYFDFIFSVSVLEHVPEGDLNFFKNILLDMDRVMKSRAFSLHAFDIVFKDDAVKRVNSFIPFVFNNVNTINKFVEPSNAMFEKDLYCMTKVAYDDVWKKITKQKMKDFGVPTSINALWQKA